MSILDGFGLIPDSLRERAFDALVRSISDQARRYLGHDAADKLEGLKSDGAFRAKLDQGLQRAAGRFVREYEAEDEDLVAAIIADEAFFENPQVQQALLAIVQRPGVYLADEREMVLESFETVLPGRKNRQRVDRAVTFLLRCLAEELWSLPELQGVYALQFQRMTAEAARQQVELQQAQLQATAGLSAGIRETLLQLTDALAEHKRLPPPGGTAPPTQPKVYHNLPQPDYGTFIGREEELRQVHRILRPYPHSRHAVVTIDGIGGIGKSALALEVAHRYLRDYERLPPEERFEAIVWTSAKTSVLTADSIAPRQQAIRTLEDIYTTISITLGREDITRASPEQQNALVAKALTRQRTLLIVDNFETVDDRRVNTFLRELPAPTKAIVTTRHRIDVAWAIRLAGMSQQEGYALITQECKEKGIVLTPDQTGRLYSRTGGMPLAIVWSIAQMAYGFTVASVLRRLGQPSGDIARFCFEGVLERIQGTAAHRLLMALASFPGNVSREALGYIADLPDLDRDDSLGELERLSLANKSSIMPVDLAHILNRHRPRHPLLSQDDDRASPVEEERFYILPMTRRFVLLHSSYQENITATMKSRQVDYYTAFVSSHKLSSDAMDLIRVEHSNIAAVLDILMASGDFERVVDIFRHYYPFLWRQGHWGQGIKLAHQVLEWAELTKNERLQARCSHWLGRFYLYQRRYSEAERYLLRSARLYSQVDWQWISVQTYLAQVFLWQARFEDAYRILQATLPVAQERKDNRGATRIYNAFAENEISRSSPDLNEALNYVETGYDLIEGRNSQTTVLGQNYHLRGKILRILGQLGESREWIARYVNLAHREGFVQEEAQGILELARIEQLRGATTVSARLAESAGNIFERLGMGEELQECRELFRRLTL